MDEGYPLEFEVSENGKIVAKEFIEEERIKRKELSQKIDKYNKERDLWIVREAYNRYGYEVAEWMTRIRKVEMLMVYIRATISKRNVICFVLNI